MWGFRVFDHGCGRALNWISSGVFSFGLVSNRGWPGL